MKNVKGAIQFLYKCTKTVSVQQIKYDLIPGSPQKTVQAQC